MIVTPEEAKKLWCPHVRCECRESVQADSASNCLTPTKAGNQHNVPLWATCVSTRCMMWRWYDSEHTKGFCGLIRP